MGLLFDSVVYDLLAVAFGLALYFFLSMRSRLRYFEGSGIPYVPCGGLLENNTVGAFTKESLGDVYDVIYKKLAGHKYGGMFNATIPCIMIRDPELVQQVMIKDFQSFNHHGIPSDEEINPLEGNLFSLSGAKWRTVRQKLSPTFTSGKLKGMFSLIKDCSRDLLQYISDKRGTDIDVKNVLGAFSIDVIGSCAFGLDLKSLKNPDNEFIRLGKEVFNPGSRQIFIESIRLMFPSFYQLIRISSQPKRIVNFFQSLTAQTLEHRMKTGEQRNDFVQLLLQLKLKGYVETDVQDREELEGEDIGEKELVKVELTDSLLSAQAFVFLVGGFETTAATISFTLYLLGKHKDCQEKAKRDVKKAKEKNRGIITYDACKDMRYLEACVNECLRLYSPFQLLPRMCTKDYKMEDGYIIKKGKMVVVPTYSLHRDPEYFSEPEKFKPERFLDDQETIIPGTYLPFGAGPRICLARRFALLETMLAVSMILDSYHISVSPKMREPLKLAPGFITAAKGGIWLNFEKAT